MGTFRYPIMVHGLDLTKSRGWRRWLVDTGATYTLVPHQILEGLGYRPTPRRKLRLANGSVMEREGAEILVEMDGARLTTVAIFGESGTETLRGAVTLEEFSLAPDPVARRLVPVEALLM